MRSLTSSVAVFVALASFAAPAFAKSETVTGQLIDQQCYLMEKKVESDSACAIQCAKSGKPVAVLTADGKVYQITGGLAANKNAKLADHMLKKVEITGEVSQQNGQLSIAADRFKMLP
mgnify:CR=1 FL=1